jgi:UDP-4-amino-4-deoxy-L-arabinose-oxoglutarate aminotransferase
MAGTLGQACFLSFHATKLLTTGEGGMVLTNDTTLLRKMRELKQGSPNRLTIRYASPMTDIQVALGLSQLARYAAFLDRRRTIADYYFSELDGLSLSLPRHVRNRSIFFRFPVRTKGVFEELQRMFDREGIYVRRGVDTLLHRQCSLNPNDFPVTERIFSETLSIPIYPALSDKDCERIVGTCHAIFKKACTGAT